MSLSTIFQICGDLCVLVSYVKKMNKNYQNSWQRRNKIPEKEKNLVLKYRKAFMGVVVKVSMNFDNDQSNFDIKLL